MSESKVKLGLEVIRIMQVARIAFCTLEGLFTTGWDVVRLICCLVRKGVLFLMVRMACLLM